jgi:hypothetical protein
MDEEAVGWLFELMPADTPAYMAPAWAACMHWAIGKPEIVASFREETGKDWNPGQTPIERMVDGAAGGGRAFVEAFITWANKAVWGSPSAGEPEVARG